MGTTTPVERSHTEVAAPGNRPVPAAESRNPSDRRLTIFVRIMHRSPNVKGTVSSSTSADRTRAVLHPSRCRVAGWDTGFTPPPSVPGWGGKRAPACRRRDGRVIPLDRVGREMSRECAEFPVVQERRPCDPPERSLARRYAAGRPSVYECTARNVFGFSRQVVESVAPVVAKG
jgi:hypothetical protein